MKQNNRGQRHLWLWLLPLLLLPTIAYAHGTVITLGIATPPTITINALYDTGEPMSEAQILVYAADDPRNAWHTGTADTAGNYQFDLDTNIEGQWSIAIRTAGHGEIRYLYVARNGDITLEQPEKRPLWQTALMATIVIVALLGIAWYYSSQGEKNHAHS
ncbi:MAG TPA: hypothetical protein VLL52_24520 [Anaerolineae bacterium]|nr:hypothetical protein [Anaerolineae bacterium]